ncbi:SH3 domain-containing protein [Purpureocillium lavendulum]|uniref:SH3 domain-containing protein n=1 Tax=Purpureocillium lavendulum TaxID=1247861 RepID=A0AB34FG11_9HYPO|nr:SH3 domain-containing protein [Purpureocillium lavendulum]
MPQDPNLYGQRPAKKQKRGTALSSSLDFKAQLSSLVSNASASGTTSGRVRPSKGPKDDIFRHKPKQAGRDDANKLVLKEVAGTEDEAQELARARRKMEDKARRYAAMKRGDYVPGENEAEPLVDFDRKWAEGEEGKDGYASTTSSDDDDDDQDEAANEIIEWDDEFGRRRRGTRAEKEKMERWARRGLLGAEELERMSARPAAPSNLIYGDAIQAMAFNPEDADKMEELAQKRDRSATPPEMKHYDADKEIRTKGVGFYKFSKDEEGRTREFASLEEERKQTEQERKTREDQKEARRLEIERRRRDMGARRAKRQADSFLDGLTEG